MAMYPSSQPNGKYLLCSYLQKIGLYPLLPSLLIINGNDLFTAA